MAAKPVPASARSLRAFFMLTTCTAIFLLTASPVLAQKKKKKDSNPPAETHTMIPMPDEQQIDYNISAMLGAWQVGDIDRLHQAYADDVVFVSGVWAPPVFGWSNYLPIYQQQRARMQQVRLDRVNTYIKVSGAVGWACYQWDFAGTVDGKPTTTRGQTTLVFEKRSDRWLIVHNHTSESQPAPPATTQPQQPATPANTQQTQPQLSKPPNS
jgi:ketosteroid isomerase-like protein